VREIELAVSAERDPRLREVSIEFDLGISRPPDIFCFPPASAPFPCACFINLSAVTFELYVSPRACIERGEAEVYPRRAVSHATRVVPVVNGGL